MGGTMSTVLDPGERLGTYFRVREFTTSETADRLGIVIEIEAGSDVEARLRGLVIGVLDPLREDLGLALNISSGWRPPAVNEAVGGAPTSQHETGEAADVWAVGVTPFEIAHRVVKLSLPYDQLILEHDQGVVHVSHVHGRNRREALTRYVSDGELVYRAGLLPEEHLS